VVPLKWDEHIDLRHRFILLDKTKNGEKREIPEESEFFDVLTSMGRVDIFLRRGRK
jgi:hypothetical protein